MSNNKKNDLNQVAEVLKALSNPNRLKIFTRLASCCRPGTVSYIDDENTACVGELGENLSIVKSTVSHHLKVLRDAGLVRVQRHGKEIFYTLNQEKMADNCCGIASIFAPREKVSRG